MDANAKRNLPSRWVGVEEMLPTSLSHLAGPPGGVVELPYDLAWSGRRSFDLANPVQRYMYHMTVLTSGVTREHYTSWLNVDLLRVDVLKEPLSDRALMYPDEEFAEYGYDSVQSARIRAWAQTWAAHLNMEIAEAEQWSDDE
jgi:hypothetical protein